MTDEIGIFVCPPRCGDDGHDWTGPWIKTPDLVSSVTCKKCGLAKFDYDMMRLP